MMTQDEIIRMAREVWGERAVLPFNELEHFAATVAEATGIEQQREIMRLKAIIEEQANGAQNLVLAEREACAKVCDELNQTYYDSEDVYYTGWEAADNCAAAIRAMGEK